MIESTATPGHIEHELIIPGAHAQSFEVEAGRHFAITQIEGRQVGDLVAFNHHDLTEYLSTTHTIGMLKSIYPKVGDLMYTNRLNPILQVVKDDVGIHDLLYIWCNANWYAQLGRPGHRNCLDNLTEALSPYGIDSDRVPLPFNTFQNTSVGTDGKMQSRDSVARPGDQLVLKAMQDLVVAVSACPWDLTPLNGGRSKDLKVTIFGRS